MIATAQVSQQLQQFCGEKADQVARETQFVQRQSKMTGSKFLQIWVQGFLERSEASLELLCQVAEDLGVPITKQGMQQRLTPAAVTFLEAMFEHSRVTLQNEIPLALELLTQFTAIEIVDSSSVALPDKLAEEFPGAGGGESARADPATPIADAQTIHRRWTDVLQPLVALWTDVEKPALA